MKYLPFENITYKTRLSRAEIINKLNSVTEPYEPFRFNFFSNKKTKTYQGEIFEDGFRLTRIISGRNSFLPIIKGTFIDDGTGLEINVKMRLHPFVIAFLCIWMGFVSVPIFMVVLTPILHLNFIVTSNWAVLFPISMLTFCYAITIGGFKFESAPTKKRLQTLFEAEMAEK